MSQMTQSSILIAEHDALNRVPSGIGVYDVCGDQVTLRYLNDGYYQMVGESRESRSSFTGPQVLEAIHPDDRMRILEEAHAAMREHRLFGLRFRVLSGSGAYIWVGIRANHMPLDDTTERFYASYYNVNDYISRQTALETLSSAQKEILGNIPGGIVVFSYHKGEIRIEYANNGFYDSHHGSRSYWMNKGTNPVTWLQPEDQKIFWEAFDKVRTGKQKQAGAAYRITGEDGQVHWMNNRFCFAYLRDDIPYYYGLITDMDELKAAEQARTEVRRMYEAAVEDSSLVVWEYDIRAHRIIMAENEFTKYDYRKFGLPKITENAPQSLVPYIADASVSVFLEMYRRIDNGEPHASCDVWYKLKPGQEPRCEHISYMTVYDNAGTPVRAYGIGQNITRQRLAQEEYERMREQLTGNLMDVVGSFQLNLSKNRCLSGYSPYPGVAESLLRDTADGHFAATADTIIDEKIQAQVRQEYTCEKLVRHFTDGQDKIRRDYPVRTSAGGIMWVHSTLHMMQNPNTGDVEGITYTKDISAQKRNEEIIRELASTSCDYIGVLDTVKRTFEMHTRNWSCQSILAGQKKDYEDARRLLVPFLPEGQQADFLEATDLDTVAAALKSSSQYTAACDLQTPKDGTLRKKQIVFRRLNDSQREILCIQQDVTETYRKEQEQIAALEKAKKEADAANEAKSAFLSSMSHDLRTPLNGVLSFTAFALKETDAVRRQDYLEKVDASGKLLLDLINDTLELSRIESGKLTVEPETVLLRDLIPAVAVALRPSAEIKSIDYQTDFPEDLSVTLWCDKLKIQKIVLNLISNAIKYTPAGGSVAVRLETGELSGPDFAYHLTVKDTGIGMSAEFMKHMYEPFAQEKRSEVIKSPGTGLGLSIVKKYIDLLDGSIEVESRVHEGTCFRVTLPVRLAGARDICTENEEPSDQELSGKRVLLCEDNSMNTEIAVTLLAEQGISTETAANGREGLEIFAASAAGYYDAVLMDIRMPVMDGCEAARRIRALDRTDAAGIPIIAMTADAFEESIREAAAAGMDGYVTKPIDPNKLYRILKQKLRRTAASS